MTIVVSTADLPDWVFRVLKVWLIVGGACALVLLLAFVLASIAENSRRFDQLLDRIERWSDLLRNHSVISTMTALGLYLVGMFIYAIIAYDIHY